MPDLSHLRRGLVRFEHHDGDEFDQIQRVLRVLSQVDPRALPKIEAAYDQKGCLTVQWAVAPTDRDFRAVESAWSAEHECELEHVLPDGERIATHTGITSRGVANQLQRLIASPKELEVITIARSLEGRCGVAVNAQCSHCDRRFHYKFTFDGISTIPPWHVDFECPWCRGTLTADLSLIARDYGG